MFKLSDIRHQLCMYNTKHIFHLILFSYKEIVAKSLRMLLKYDQLLSGVLYVYERI